MMQSAHPQMAHYAMHQGTQQAMNMAPGGMAYFGIPNSGMNSHMAGYHGPMNGPMPQAYGYQSYVGGPAPNGNSHMSPEMMYRSGAMNAGYYGYSHFQPSDTHMYGYGTPMAAPQQQPGGGPVPRAHSVGGEDASKSASAGFAVPGLNRAHMYNMGLSASPPSSEGSSNGNGNWNKSSSPRGSSGGKRGGGNGGGKGLKSSSNQEPSLSSSTEDLLSLAGKPHLIKDLGPSGSLEFSGSMGELPAMLSTGSPGPHSPRSPQHPRKQIKIQRNTNNGGHQQQHHQNQQHSHSHQHHPHHHRATTNTTTATTTTTTNVPSSASHDVRGEMDGESVQQQGQHQQQRNGSHPMPIGWTSSSSNGDDITGLLSGVHLGGGPNSHSSGNHMASIGSSMAHPEFVMGSGSPILARMHHPAAANGNAAPGSNTNISSQSGPICHYYTMGMCGKGDKCRYVHLDDGSGGGIVDSTSSSSSGGRNSGRRTPRAPATTAMLSPVSFGSGSSGGSGGVSDSTNANGAQPLQSQQQHQQQQQQQMLAQHQMSSASSLINGSQSAVVGMTSTSSIGQAPLLSPINPLLGPGSGSAMASNNTSVSAIGSGAGAVGGGGAAAAAAAQNVSSMRYSNATLEECVGQIFQMCKDQYGCRFLQKKLDEDKTATTCDMIFGEILPEVVELMSDPFGNYLCQKLIEKCTPAQRLAVVRGVSGSLVQISKNMHGTRAVQKTIEQLGSPEEIRLIREALKGSVVALIQDLNGNHVIQKCIHRLEPNDNQFIYDAVAYHCVQVATHRHGCCVMQRCIDHSSNQQKMQLIEEIKNNALNLVQDQFGNYVVQYVLDLGMESVCEALATNLLGHLYFLSTQKFSSNVVEKCLKVGNAATVQMMSRELAEFQNDPHHPVFPQTPHDDPLICLLQHPFGNYVVQTALQVAQLKAIKEWNMIAARIRPLIPNLRSNTYVKRVQGLLAQAKQVSEAGVTASDYVNGADANTQQQGQLQTQPNNNGSTTAAEDSAAPIAANHHHNAQPQQAQSQQQQHHHHHGSRSHGANRSQGGGGSGGTGGGGGGGGRHNKEHGSRAYEQRRH
jgi:uncharacterized membrane protein YgcG